MSAVAQIRPPMNGQTVAAAKRQAAVIDLTARAIMENMWLRCRELGIKHPRFGDSPKWHRLLEAERDDYRVIAERVIAQVRQAREEGRV